MIGNRSTCRLIFITLVTTVVANVHHGSNQKVKFTPGRFDSTLDLPERPTSVPGTAFNMDSYHLKEEATSLGLYTRGGFLSNKQKNEYISVAIFMLLDVAFRRTFKHFSIAFPSMLGGCCLIFVALVGLDSVGLSSLAESISTVLTPGSNWLAKWLPVFFVPGLAMLPLAPSVGNFKEVIKALSVVVLGWLFTLTTVAYTALGVSSLLGKESTSSFPIVPAGGGSKSANPYTAKVLKNILTGVAVFLPISIGVTRTGSNFAIPVETALMCLTTFGAFVFGARLPAAFKAIVHPLVTSTFFTMLMTKFIGILTDKSFKTALGAYKAGTISLMHSGAGDLILWMLGPAVVSLCIPMYSRRILMKENFLVIAISTIVSAVGALFGTAFYVKFMKIACDVVRRSVLSRNVTTALGIAITSMLEGNIAIASVAIVLTGIIGGTFSRKVLDKYGITDPIIRGLSVGSSSQGLGVASMVGEKDAFPFAAVNMVLNAFFATTLVSIPSIRDTLLKIALD
uniref:Plastidal glycolate/glycerate translocator 1, chloroplastic n=1 Tax=Proboscia inermis TaxID=420281 RepID=A0A7S0CB64_9STRA|mmetsp:Transcript_10186/g.11652  ORF Transcript_10186/g.11652 Transcript_10186/m.11652 type:complete len:511 (-) Transcript_10186:413-1945(-)